MRRLAILMRMAFMGWMVTIGCAPVTVQSPGTTGASSEDREITLRYENSAQFEIISPQGQRVLIDISNAAALSSPVTKSDILLTTHGHADHYSVVFSESFPGRQLKFREGKIEQADVSIQGIASAHVASDELKSENGSNYIYIVDVGGMRIVHFGDIGQDRLTQKQLDALGKVDIAFTQFENSYSEMDIVNKKGFNLMDQVKPKLIIPTHIGRQSVKHAVGKWKGYARNEEPVILKRSGLSSESRILLLGKVSQTYREGLNLAEW